ncbi:hypothetical protein DLD99_11890 [Pseudomonas kribbensis]|uniref:PNPLA domain-containing protein n=1 Tax=Pseudomonas kribbensis TaxID=1628086 RepID=A0A345RPC6_9PSED|nr:hypothetical protein DLD99_11890 [Pseudomonas kribbensis]
MGVAGSTCLRILKTLGHYLLALFFLSTLPACSPRIINEENSFAVSKPLGDATTYTFANWVSKDHNPALTPDLIIVTLSGGGIRAAALAASTLNELRKFTINGHPLTDNIILISSTSGGSIAAGYIAAHGFDHYADFHRDFLEKNNSLGLFFSGLGPRLINDRSAILQDYMEKRFALNQLTFDQLLKKPDAPFFVFNSTDVVGGHVFRFTQHDFNLICTDVGKMPISSGMAASSALPFVLTDLELKNHWDTCGLQGYKDSNTGDTGWYLWASAAAEARYREQFVIAYDGIDNNLVRRRPQYLHLADGGMVDNLGARAIAEVVDIDDMGSISELIPTNNPHMPTIRQILIIEVNARSEPGDPSLDAHRGSPGLVPMVGIVTGIPIDSTTSLSSFMSDVAWASDVSGGKYVKDGMILKTQIDFDLIPDSEDSLRHDLKAIGMGFTLSTDELKALEKASRVLLHNNPCFARFISQSGATASNYVLPDAVGKHGYPFDCPRLIEDGGGF